MIVETIDGSEQDQFAEARALTDKVLAGCGPQTLLIFVAGDQDFKLNRLESGHSAFFERLQGRFPLLIFRQDVTDPANDIDLDTLSERLFREFNESYDLVNVFMSGMKDHWYPLLIQQADLSGTEDFKPQVSADYNASSVHFHSGRMPNDSNIVYVVANLVVQLRALSTASRAARQVLVHADSQNREVLRTLDGRLGASRDRLVEATILLEPRLACYEGFDFDLVSAIRGGWRMIELESVAKSALTECRLLLQENQERLARRQRTFTGAMLTALAVVSSLTAVLTVTDFAVNNEDMAVQSPLRLIEAAAFSFTAVALSAVLYFWKRTRTPGVVDS